MIERPIIFSGDMVRAILEDRKTKTRRVMNPQPETWHTVKRQPFVHSDYPGIWSPLADNSENRTQPYDVGDHLWVRETFCVGYPTGEPKRWSCLKPTDERVAISLRRAFYKVDSNDPPDEPQRHWTPSIHMPRWASRITLEVTGVRVERLNDISEADAIAEGCEAIPTSLADIEAIPENSLEGKLARALGPGMFTGRLAFMELWDSIYAKKHPWSSNPWVWVIEFRRVTP
jgi:hypothetical protein